MDGHVLVLAGDGKRRLSFEIEMLLSADLDPAFDDARRRRNRRCRVALGHGVGRLQETLRCHRVLDGEQSGQVFVDHRGFRGGGPRLFDSLRGDAEQRLAEILDSGGRKKRIVPGHRADVVGAGDIAGGHDRRDAFARPDSCQVH